MFLVSSRKKFLKNIKKCFNQIFHHIIKCIQFAFLQKQQINLLVLGKDLFFFALA